jgi:hypothetical protein
VDITLAANGGRDLVRALQEWVIGPHQRTVVVSVGYADDAARFHHAKHFAEGPNRLVQVLEDSVDEDRIEAGVGVRQGTEVMLLERDVGDAAFAGEVSCGDEDIGGDVDTDDFAWCDGFSEAKRDGPWPAASIEQAHAGFEVRKEEGGILGRRAARVRAAMR